MKKQEDKVEISLIVPVYNEQDIIEETIRIFLKDLDSICKDYELIIVDDSSTDNTWNVLEDLSSRFKDKLRIFRNTISLSRL